MAKRKVPNKETIQIKEGFWSRFLDAADAYLDSLFSGKDSFSQRRIITASKLWNYFDPDFPVLDADGVCNGLVLDYARHTMRAEIKSQSKKTGKDKQYFAEKLKRKFTIFGSSSKNFAERIKSYQEILQAGKSGDSNHIKLANDSINNNELIKKLEEEIEKGGNLFGLTFSSSKRGGSGHIIAIQAIKGTNPQKYQVFDPNKGTFDCQNPSELTDKLKELFALYEKQGLGGGIEISNLGKIVQNSGLLQNKLGSLVEIHIGARKLVRNNTAANQELQDFLSNPLIEKSFFGFKTKKYDFEKIAAYIAAIKPEDLTAEIQDKLSFKEIINNSPNIPPDRKQLSSQNFTTNILKICDTKNSTDRLVELIESRKAKEFPDLVVELVKRGANLQDKSYKKKFQEHFKTTSSCKELAIYAVKKDDFALLKTLDEYSTYNKARILLSTDFKEGKSLLQMAKDEGKVELAKQMEEYGFKLTTKEKEIEAERAKEAAERERKMAQRQAQQQNDLTNRKKEETADKSQETVQPKKSIFGGWFSGSKKGIDPEREPLLRGDENRVPNEQGATSGDDIDQILADLEGSSRSLHEARRLIGSASDLIIQPSSTIKDKKPDQLASQLDNLGDFASQFRKRGGRGKNK